MAELTTIARPYAKALFDLSSNEGNRLEWSKYLDVASMLAADRTMVEVLKNPGIDVAVKIELMSDLAKNVTFEGTTSFVESLAHYGRLAAIPAIAIEFKRLLASSEEALDFVITSAFPLTKSQINLLESKLKGRFSGKAIRIETTVEKNLIGGFEIRSRDTVIDATVRGRLSKITALLTV